MTWQDLDTLLDYNYWARDRMLDALDQLTTEQFTRTLGGSFSCIRDTASHMLGAEIVWYTRWQGQSLAALPLEAFADSGSLRRAWAAHEGKMRAHLSAVGEQGVDRMLDYTLFSGTVCRSPFWQTLQHLANHGTYHRGQVTTLIRQVDGKAPESSDLIAYYRATSR